MESKYISRIYYTEFTEELQLKGKFLRIAFTDGIICVRVFESMQEH
ncbi:MAG: hypothetical protein ACRC3G_03550 [Bacteroidales bacterium]